LAAAALPHLLLGVAIGLQAHPATANDDWVKKTLGTATSDSAAQWPQSPQAPPTHLLLQCMVLRWRRARHTLGGQRLAARAQRGMLLRQLLQLVNLAEAAGQLVQHVAHLHAAGGGSGERGEAGASSRQPMPEPASATNPSTPPPTHPPTPTPTPTHPTLHRSTGPLPHPTQPGSPPPPPPPPRPGSPPAAPALPRTPAACAARPA